MWTKLFIFFLHPKKILPLSGNISVDAVMFQNHITSSFQKASTFPDCRCACQSEFFLYAMFSYKFTSVGCHHAKTRWSALSLGIFLPVKLTQTCSSCSNQDGVPKFEIPFLFPNVKQMKNSNLSHGVCVEYIPLTSQWIYHKMQGRLFKGHVDAEICSECFADNNFLFEFYL